MLISYVLNLPSLDLLSCCAQEMSVIFSPDQPAVL